MSLALDLGCCFKCNGSWPVAVTSTKTTVLTSSEVTEQKQWVRGLNKVDQVTCLVKREGGSVQLWVGDCATKWLTSTLPEWEASNSCLSMFTPDYTKGKMQDRPLLRPLPLPMPLKGQTWPNLCSVWDVSGGEPNRAGALVFCCPCPWASGDVNKGGEGESFRQLPTYSQEGGKPESRKHYSIVFWNWLNMCKITVLMINTVINIGRTWIQPLQRLLFF